MTRLAGKRSPSFAAVADAADAQLTYDPAATGRDAWPAALQLAAHAKDAAELREWLEICGLMRYRRGKRGGYRAEGSAVMTSAYRRP